MTFAGVIGYLIVLVGFGVTANAIWRRPARGLLVLAALLPFHGLLKVLPHGLVPSFWKEGLILLTLVLAVVGARGRPRGDFHAPWWPAVAALVVFGSLSAVFTAGTLAALPVKITFFYVLLVVICWFAPLTVHDRDRLVTVLMAIGVVNAVYGVVQQMLGTERLVAMGYEYGQEVREAGGMLRSFGTFNQPFPYALMLMLVILIGLSVSLNDPSRLRSKVFFWCMPLLLVGQALSVVRASFIGLITGLVVLGVIRYRVVLYALGGLAVAALPVLLLAPTSITGTIFSTASSQTRADGWKATMGSVVDNPFGKGLGTSGAAAEQLVTDGPHLPESLAVRIDGASAYAFGLPYQPDSYYMKVLVELGPIGLWLFVTFLVVSLLSAVTVSRRAVIPYDGAFAAGVAAVIAASAAASIGATLYEIFPMDAFTWLLLGAVGCIQVTAVGGRSMGVRA
ncbi:hypothetical protein nbrc107696_07960 [Gordonia spumicola]|uniref:O-antigen ligase-related domain-containing protein n=1 Tax=Gordonia spumicola TaxID=589161 RepID=A0A7I9V5L3_9ACTN|nr:O-antigen ligase family protein [Gordonia spumicola]GEE00350.1 hypothetical protein nbrc107696_07960 [Gordonia spumicola]